MTTCAIPCYTTSNSQVPADEKYREVVYTLASLSNAVFTLHGSKQDMM